MLGLQDVLRLDEIPRPKMARPHTEDDSMAWKTPKYEEIPVGMEINMYACAKQK